MDRDSVTARLAIEPAIQGEIAWAGTRLILRPSEALETGTRYTVVLQPGAESEQGRKVLAEHRFSFDVSGPRVAYLAPEDGALKDIWLRDPEGQAPAQRLTNSAQGVVAFDVSPDGSRIVYAERNSAKNATAATNLKLLTLDSNDVRALTDCGNFVCTNPVWSPDGSQIAYERLAYSTFEPGISTTSSRVWLLEPDASPPRTRPLFADAQTPPNYRPRWAPDGKSVAVSQLPASPDRNPGIQVVSLADGSTQFFPTSFASMAIFSPDGASLTYPNFSVQGGAMQTVLQVADVHTGTTVQVPGLTQAHEALAEWRPDGSELIVSRRATGTEQVRASSIS
jgi:Tol biopolymer transport system component